MNKLYAAQIKNVNHFDTNVSVLAEVYGFYDSADHEVLHQIEPKMVTFRMSNKLNNIGDMITGARLVIPALGVSERGREINSKNYSGYGPTTVYELMGVNKTNIIVLNKPKMQEDVVTKSGRSSVMAGALSVMQELGKKLASFF